MTDVQAEGSTAAGFEPVAAEFTRILAEEADARGQFCAFAGGRPVVDLWGGADVAPDDLQGVYSSTKGVAAVCVALLVQRDALDLDAPVSRYWPEFAGGGKGDVTLRLALSHQAGLPGVEPQLTLEEVMDHDATAARLAAQVPHWRPGRAHGYHGLTIGTIMDELVRRTTGVPVAEFFRKEVGDPRGIDFYIRTPEDVDSRVRPVLPQSPSAEQAAAAKQAGPPPAGPDSIPGMTFSAAAGPAGEPLPNIRAFRASGQAAAAGVGSARGLARLYAMCTGEVDGFPRLLTDARSRRSPRSRLSAKTSCCAPRPATASCSRRATTGSGTAVTRRSATTVRAAPSPSPTRGTASPGPGSPAACRSPAARTPAASVWPRSCATAWPRTRPGRLPSPPGRSGECGRRSFPALILAPRAASGSIVAAKP
jgi:CubicO group peptidase (beta-lactamase class C family)